MLDLFFISILGNFWVVTYQTIILSISASIIFLVLLFLLRPRIKIADKIAFFEGKYIIKTINRSFFRIYDVKFQLTIKHTYGTPGGKNVRYSRLNLKRGEKLTYPRRPFIEKKCELFEHAVLVSIEDNIREKWTNESDTLEFIVIAKHGLSSFAKIYKVKYDHLGTDIVNGEYKHGNTMEIVVV